MAVDLPTPRPALTRLPKGATNSGERVKTLPIKSVGSAKAGSIHPAIAIHNNLLGRPKLTSSSAKWCASTVWETTRLTFALSRRRAAFPLVMDLVEKGTVLSCTTCAQWMAKPSKLTRRNEIPTSWYPQRQ